MNQTVNITAPFSITQEIIDRFLAQQGPEEIVRSLAGDVENVDYLPDSTIRFWYNSSLAPFDAHWHPAIEMIMPTEGNYIVTLAQQTYELTPGDIFLIPSGALHTLRPPTRGGRFIFLFDLDFMWKLKGSGYLANLLNAPVLINRSTCPSIYEDEAAIIHQMCLDYLDTDSRLRDMILYNLLVTLLLNYARYHQSMEGSYTMTQSSPTVQRSYAEKFNAVLDYLDRHFAEDLTLEGVAAVAGFSKFHFSRTFKQLAGCNFYEYLCHRRIKSSEMLLMKPGLSVSQIALQSGFSSVSTFNRTFRKLKGCTPTEYRSMFQLRTETAPKERAHHV